MSKEYDSLIYKLPETTNIFDTDINPRYSESIDRPMPSLGFIHQIHINKDKMEIVNGFKGNKLYHVVNPFETEIDKSNESIAKNADKFFIKNNSCILSRAFFKLWEIIFDFNLLSESKGITSVHLAEGPGSFIQSVMFYRDTYMKKYSKKDKYYAITVHPKNKGVKPISEEFVEHCETEKPARFNLHQTYPTDEASKSKDKDNGDLTNLKTIKNFTNKHNLKNNAELVTADGGFFWKDENLQEQEAFPLLLGEIITALRVQAKGGAFVCKFFEMFSISTVKLMCVLSSVYEEIYIVKPYTSRPSNSERYVVCLNFKGIDDKNIKILEDLLEDLFNRKDNIINLFPKYSISSMYHATITKANIDISNVQLITINKIVKYISEKNLYGDDYVKYRKEQIEASKYWTDLYLPKQDVHKKILSDIQLFISNSGKNNQLKIQDLKNKLTK